jgi:diacylglycerol kinase (ATP)
MDYDNNQREIFGMMITASNMPSYGGGMRITPDADPEDGLLDICIIKRMSKLHFVKVFPKVYEGKHIEDSNVEIFRTSHLKLDSEYRFSVFADGEYICKLPAIFKVVPKKLNFIVSS